MAAYRQDAAGHITAQRANRLYRLLCLLGRGPQTRGTLARKLKVDQRGFYRDLERLRSLGIGVTAVGNKYHLEGDLDDALALLPVPDPGLSVREALVLARGHTPVHRRFRQRLEALIGLNGHDVGGGE